MFSAPGREEMMADPQGCGGRRLCAQLSVRRYLPPPGSGEVGRLTRASLLLPVPALQQRPRGGCAAQLAREVGVEAGP